jgi:tau tubulin kinase
MVRQSSFTPIPKPTFPECGGIIGESYFAIGKIGSGTFCSISKCIDLGYHHEQQPHTNESNTSTANNDPKDRIVACKFELANFANSGVLEGEANVLRHLSKHMPSSMIPKYFGMLNDNDSEDKRLSCIVMEYLAGEDMDRLRYRHAQLVTKQKEPGMSGNYSTVQKYRRLNVNDAVYLCRDVFLPLLQNMHNVGVIHRDVKPSNCVRVGTGASEKTFKLVDFGLSKSFVVPEDSSYANPDKVWNGPWDVPLDYVSSGKSISGRIRKERDDAEFRGTSMYASLRVHQKKDYCRRDDMWGLMYVFCDLVSGGLPWMNYAANRNRQMCQIIKEYVHGERENMDENTPGDSSGQTDRFEELLKGAEYHLSKFKYNLVVKDMKEHNIDDYDVAKLPKIAEPLAIASDSVKVNALRDIFKHLASLEFSDPPDYDLISNCLGKFLEQSDAIDSDVPLINWEQPSPEEVGHAEWKKIGSKRPKKMKKGIRQSLVFEDDGDVDPLHDSTLEQADDLKEIGVAQQADKVEGGFRGSSMNYGSGTALSTLNATSANESELSRLPLQLQFRLAQVEYNATNPDTIPLHLAFRDWMELATSLVYDTWDSEKYEKGNHRTNDDGYRRELFLRLVHQTLEAAKPFDNFISSDCFYFEDKDGRDDVRYRKKRKITIASKDTIDGDATSRSPFLAFSKVSCALRALFEIEKERLFAPPPALSFSTGF